MHHIGNTHKYARRICGSAPCSSPPPQMMKRQKEKYGWEFIFLRANIDAVMSGTTCAVRKTGTLSVDWKTRSDEDFKKRKKK